MKLENQVCTLEQAKRLKELGVNASATWYAAIDNKGCIDAYVLKINDGTMVNPNNSACYSSWPVLPLYTVAELGVMLPTYTESHTSGMKETWYCGKLEEGDGDFFSIEATEAIARAQYLIHLLENGLTTAEEVNQRLTQNQ